VESNIAAEPSDDEIAAPHIEATAEASTECAASALFRRLELHDVTGESEHQGT
jgi:hypothetical protein